MESLHILFWFVIVVVVVFYKLDLNNTSSLATLVSVTILEFVVFDLLLYDAWNALQEQQVHLLWLMLYVIIINCTDNFYILYQDAKEKLNQWTFFLNHTQHLCCGFGMCAKKKILEFNLCVRKIFKNVLMRIHPWCTLKT